MGFNAAQWIWQNGEFVPWQNATVHVLSHGLHYGSTVFEGIRAYDTPRGSAIFRLREHIARLYDSARIYRMQLKYTPAQVEQACRDLIRNNRLFKGAYLRPIIYRGMSGFSLAPKPDAPIEIAIAAVEMGRLPRQREPGAGRRRLRVLVAADRAQHHADPGQGRRQLPVQPADQHGGAAPRLCRGHRGGHRRHAERGRRREPVPGAQGRARTRRPWAPRSSPASPATASSRWRATSASRCASSRCRARRCTSPTRPSSPAPPARSRRSARSTASPSAPGSAARSRVQLQEAFFGLFNGRTRDVHGWLDRIEPEVQTECDVHAAYA